MPNQTLAGKVAIVTGCGSPGGIGAACARRLLADGATVIVTDRVAEDAARVAADMDGAVSSMGVDVTDRAQIDACVSSVLGQHGRIDILINNAGTSAGAKPFLEITAEDWAQSLGVNLKGTADFCQAVIPAMQAQGEGVIVNMSSMVGLAAQRAFGAYTTTKHGLIGMTKTIAAEFGPDGIRCVAVCPGFIATDFHEAVNQRMADEQGVTLEDIHKQRYATVALRRAGTADEVAGLVAFACGPEGRYITGVPLAVTGGVQMGL